VASPSPTVQEYYTAASNVYADNAIGTQNGTAPPPSTGLTLLLDSRDPSLAGNTNWLSDGFFAQVFEDAFGNIIVAFEGSILTPQDLSPYAIGSRAADASIALGQVPQALLDANVFASDVMQYLAQHGLGSNSIFLTGHSLGGAEAEYVAFTLAPGGKNIGGVTFGAPGVPGLQVPDQAPNFLNYVDFGDPVGNFENHFGTVLYVGISSNNGIPTLPINTSDHPLSHYAADLGLQAAPTMSSMSETTDNRANDVNAGHLITITITTSVPVAVAGAPALQLNDNEVAGYTGGSGTNTLTFIYAVQPGDNVNDLQVTALNLPPGASIYDQVGNALSSSVAGDLGVRIDTTTVPPTSVQQEVLGLYGALYNRAADSSGYSYWVNTVGQQADGSGVTTANAGSDAITVNDATVLSQLFVNTQSSYFNSIYGGLSDSAFINAMYLNIGGNVGDPSGIAYWVNLLQQAEAAGQSVQAARAGLLGQFVHDLIDYNINNRPAGLTDAQWQAAVQRQETIDNKIAVSIAYTNASQQPGGSILVAHTVGDAAFQAATTILQSVTYDPTTVTAAIVGINTAVAHQNLLLI